MSRSQSAATHQTVIKLNRSDSIAFVESLQYRPQLGKDGPLARAISRYKQSQGLG